MPDTGAPHFIPFADPTDLVRDWPALSEDVAEAVADGLDAAGGLVAVKHVLKTDTQTESGIAAGASFDITGLSIAHAVADVSHRLILTGTIGIAGEDFGLAFVGGAFAADGTLLGIGDADGSRTRVGSGGSNASNITDGRNTTAINLSLVYTPNTTDSVTYTLRAISNLTTTRTFFINRTQTDQNAAGRPRGVSTLTLLEVKV